MKRRYLALTFGLALSISLAACGSTTATTTSAAVEEASEHINETVYGEITAITDDTITVKVGTVPESDDSSESEDTSLDYTGETLDITLDDSVALTDATAMGGGMGSQNAGQMGGDMGGGQAPSGSTDGSAPEKPDGDQTGSTDGTGNTDGTVPEKPDGDQTGTGSTDGTVPEKPDGDQTGTGTTDGSAPAMPSGQAPSGNTDSNAGGAADGTVPEKPDGDQAGTGSTDGTVPEKPDGDTTGSGTTDGSAPAMPSGSTDGSTPEMPSGGDMTMGETITIDDLEVGDIISITYDEDGAVSSVSVVDLQMLAMMNGNSGDMGGNAGGMGGQSSGVDSYDAATEYSEDTEVSGESFSSTGTDENAILVDGGANVALDNISVDRTSSDSTGGDNSSFYGVGAAILATDGTATVTNSRITTDADGGAGVFAYGDGTVYVSNTEITTKQDTSGGIHVAGGGTLYATDCTVETNGESSAAIRSDRGGGTMTVDGGSYTSNGTGSPAIYSTADISVSNAVLTANGSEAICIEGLNSITLTDCDLTGNMSDSDQNDCTWNVILYQSMSGDSEVGNSTFTMDGGSLTAKNGGMFYTTNTESTFTLKNVEITPSDSNDFFLKCTGNSNARGWGSTGSNGADCLFTAISQDMEGDVIWDSISSLDFYMTDGSNLTGAVIDDESNAGNGGDGYCDMYISDDSTWTVTGDSTVTNLYSAGKIVDEGGSTVSVIGTDGTVYVKGTSQYTVTVSSYSTDVDLSGASQV